MAALSRVRTMPWLMVLQLAMTLRKHWKLLEPAERLRSGSSSSSPRAGRTG